MIILDVGGCRIVGVVAVPGGEVNAELQSVLVASIGELAHHIALPVFIRGVLDAIFRGLRRPEAEAIVMFRRQDNTLHARRLEGLHPLLAVEARRVEGRCGRISIAPFHVVKSIQSEVDKSISLHLMPFNLFRRRHWHDRSWRIRFPASRKRQGKQATRQGLPNVFHTFCVHVH